MLTPFGGVLPIFPKSGTKEIETVCIGWWRRCIDRRGAIRKLITEFRRSSRNPFPNWRESPADSAMPLAARDRSLEAQRL